MFRRDMLPDTHPGQGPCRGHLTSGSIYLAVVSHFDEHEANCHRVGPRDFARPRRVRSHVGKSDVEVREAIGDKFPKHIYHSIACIGALLTTGQWTPSAHLT